MQCKNPVSPAFVIPFHDLANAIVVLVVIVICSLCFFSLVYLLAAHLKIATDFQAASFVHTALFIAHNRNRQNSPTF